MNEFERYAADAADVRLSDFHNELFIQFIEKEISADDIAAMMNNEEQRDFWEDWRIRYQANGNDVETFLEELKREETNKARKAKRNRSNDGGSRQSENRGGLDSTESDKRKIKPLPEPEVPRNRRRRRDTSGKKGAILRAARSFGRGKKRRNR